MNYFECCHYCVPPKRYPGCSGKCPDYAEGRAKYEADKAKANKYRTANTYTQETIGRIVNSRAMRRIKNQGHKWYKRG